MPCYYSQPVTDVNAIHTNKRTHTHTLFPLSPFTFNTIPRFSSAQNDSHANNCFSFYSFFLNRSKMASLPDLRLPFFGVNFRFWVSRTFSLISCSFSFFPSFCAEEKSIDYQQSYHFFFPKVFFEFTSQALYRHDRNICGGKMLWVVLKQTNMDKGLIKFCIVST